MENIKIKNNINQLLIDCIQPNQLENLEELQVHFDSRHSFYKQRRDISENLQGKTVLITI